MIARIYSVKDELSNKFHNPVFVPDGETCEDQAKRLFRSQVMNTTLWKDNPSDFSLWCLGALDDTSGAISGELTKITDGRSVQNG